VSEEDIVSESVAALLKLGSDCMDLDKDGSLFVTGTLLGDALILLAVAASE